MKVSIVCVNYNSADFTIAMTNSTLLFKDYINEFIVVDNCSKEDDYNKCKDYIDNIKDDKYRVVRSETNLGYFGGLNYGMEKLNVKSDYVIVGNNDLIFDAQFFTQLDTVKIDADVYAIAPYIETIDGIVQNPHFDSKLSKFKIFTYDIYFTNYYIGQVLLFLKSKLMPRKLSDSNVRKKYIWELVHVIF